VGVRISTVTYSTYAYGGHPGGRWTAEADRWTPRRALRYRGAYMLTLWEKGDIIPTGPSATVTAVSEVKRLKIYFICNGNSPTECNC
jgi:hypothetical protein